MPNPLELATYRSFQFTKSAYSSKPKISRFPEHGGNLLFPFESKISSPWEPEAPPIIRLKPEDPRLPNQRWGYPTIKDFEFLVRLTDDKFRSDAFHLFSLFTQDDGGVKLELARDPMSGIDFPIPHGSQLYTILERFARVRLRMGN
jgi:hypothetical protein